jgi:hypothetical protein
MRLEAIRNFDPEDGNKISFEALIDINITTRLYFPEDRNILNYRCENLKFYIKIFLFLNKFLFRGI